MIIYKQNDSSDLRDERKELQLFCYYQGLILSVKWYSVTWEWTWISWKCILQTRATTKKCFKRNITDPLRKERKKKQNFQLKPQKAEIILNKTKNKEQAQ